MNLILAIAFAALQGCKDGRPVRVPVCGTVTIDGAPLAMGTIQLIGGKGRPARGKIQSDGSFSLMTYENGDGCAPGTYSVSITAVEQVDDTTMRFLIPVKYGDPKTSTITKQIENSISDWNIDLTWKGSGNTKPYVVKEQ